MKIASVVLENIKKFNNKSGLFEFGGRSGMHTLSGGNGSGKTAIFRSVQIFQKIFFYDQLREESAEETEALHRKIWMDLDGLMSSDSALIDIAFKHSNYLIRVELLLEKDHNSWDYRFNPGAEGDMEVLGEFWNIENPTGIVAFIDASKSFSDFGVSFDDIKLLPRRERRRRFILDCVFEPEKTLQSIYRKAVIDHVQYRIDPKRTYQYFKDANASVKRISGNIEVANISATKMDGQLVIVGRTSAGAPLFDVKDFSSGERALYLTLLFLYYLPNIGILVIDEPENHLHESLLCEFYDFLENFLNSNKENDNDGDVLEKGAVPSNRSFLEQIFLTTHSKALIYKNMGSGHSFAMADNRICQIQTSEVERELRASGISTVYSRTLFVEGNTEASLMGEFFEKERIKVTPVNSCKEVISYFEKISAIHNTVHGAAFCFVIDSDNRTGEDINEIKAISPDFFDQSFYILNRHEIENLFIEEKLVLDVVNKIRNGADFSPLKIEDVRKIMKDEAEMLRVDSRCKYISSGMRLEIKRLISDPVTDVKSMKTGDLSDLISKNVTVESKDTLLIKAEELEASFDELWKSDWKKYVDGKSYMGRLCARLSKECAGVHSTRIREIIVSRVKESPEKYEFGKFYQDIINKFSTQGAL